MAKVTGQPAQWEEELLSELRKMPASALPHSAVSEYNPTPGEASRILQTMNYSHDQFPAEYHDSIDPHQNAMVHHCHMTIVHLQTVKTEMQSG